MNELLARYRSWGLEAVSTYPVVDGRCQCGAPRCLRVGRHPIAPDVEPDGRFGVAAPVPDGWTCIELRPGARRALAAWVKITKDAEVPVTLSHTCTGHTEWLWLRGQARHRVDLATGVSTLPSGQMVPLPIGPRGKWTRGPAGIAPLPLWLEAASHHTLESRARVRSVLFGNLGLRPCSVDPEDFQRALPWLWEVDWVGAGPEAREAVRDLLHDASHGSREGWEVWCMWATRAELSAGTLAEWVELHQRPGGTPCPRHDAVLELRPELVGPAELPEDAAQLGASLLLVTPAGDHRASPIGQDGRFWQVESTQPIQLGGAKARVLAVWDAERACWNEFELVHWLGAAAGFRRMKDGRRAERLRTIVGSAIRQKLLERPTEADIERTLQRAQEWQGVAQAMLDARRKDYDTRQS